MRSSGRRTTSDVTLFGYRAVFESLHPRRDPAPNEDFTGTWALEGSEVDIEDVPGTDTFVEDLEFTVVGNTFVADRVFDGVRVQVVMTKQ